MKDFQLLTFANADELARAAAAAWLDEIEAANRAGRAHCVALSGGRIARDFFASVVEESQIRKLSFERVHFFWADERCVPPTDPESNHRLARELLFQPLKIAAPQIHRIQGEEPPEMAAQAAEAELRRIVLLKSDNQPVLDLILLGMGEDGHVASLFPAESEARVSDPAVYRAIKNSPKPPPERVTLGYPAILAAQDVWVLVSGAGKFDALKAALSGSEQKPLGRVLNRRAGVRIFTDIRVA